MTRKLKALTGETPVQKREPISEHVIRLESWKDNISKLKEELILASPAETVTLKRKIAIAEGEIELLEKQALMRKRFLADEIREAGEEALPVWGMELEEISKYFIERLMMGEETK